MKTFYDTSIYNRAYDTADSLLGLFDLAAGKTQDNRAFTNYKETEDGKFILEIAVAGLDPKNLSVDQEEDMISITHSAEESSDKYIWKSLSYKNWVKRFKLSTLYYVEKVEYKFGILAITIAPLTPSPKKKTKFDINIPQPDGSTNPQLLNENSVL